MEILSGKAIGDELQDAMAKTIAALSEKPGLTVLLVGFHAPSHTYVNMKRRACTNVGIRSTIIELPDTVTEDNLLRQIEELNNDPNVDGILVQLPLPAHINAQKVMEKIDPRKDVDGFHPINMGKLLEGQTDGFIPCTPLGIVTLLEKYDISIAGKHAVIVGRSAIVGRPLAALLLQKDATVTVAHSKTQNLPSITSQADLLIAAVGRAHFITEDMIKEGAVVIDVGINRVEDAQYPKGYHLVGDVDFNGVADKCSAITPVPKGVGPMTVTMLLHNTLTSFQRKGSR